MIEKTNEELLIEASVRISALRIRRALGRLESCPVIQNIPIRPGGVREVFGLRVRQNPGTLGPWGPE